MFAGIDESTPEDAKGIYYVVSAAILLADPIEAAAALKGVIGPGRQRPFHWLLEGTVARDAMVKCLGDLGVVAHICVHYPTARKAQEEARARALCDLLPRLICEGVSHLAIEQRDDRQDARDRRVVVGTLNGLAHTGMTYDWRTEPLLWPADAVCGAVKEMLLRENDAYYEQLQSLGVISTPIYLN